MEDNRGNGQALIAGLLDGAASATASTPYDVIEASDLCVHFWVIDPPNGPTSQGSCKLCGKNQEFRNSVQGSTWNKSVSKVVQAPRNA